MERFRTMVLCGVLAASVCACGGAVRFSGATPIGVSGTLPEPEPQRVEVREDQIVPLGDLHELRARLGAYGRLIEISSRYGHDAFLKEAAQLGPILKSTLESQS